MHEPAEGALSWGSRISQLAEQHPDKIALILASREGEDRPVTWTELDVGSTRAAHLLKNRGTLEYSMVVIGLPNSLEHVLAALGVWKLGGCVLPVNARLPTPERDQILEVAGSSIVVADWTDLRMAGISSQDLRSLDDFSSEPLPDRISQPAKAIASGGSTGRSKVIVDPSPWARAPGEIAKLAAHITGFRLGQVQLIAGPLYHHAPFCWTFWGLFEDQTVVLMERFDAARAVDLIEQYGINFSCMVPTMMRRMIRLPGIQQRDLSSLEALYHTGGPCPVWLKEAWIDLVGPEKIYEAYGSTEEIGYTAIRGDEWLEHRGSVGRPGDGELKILGAEGQELAPGEVGEVFMRRSDRTGPTYECMGSVPAETTPDGFASVGDLGWVDEDGYLFLADRRVDMIVSGGANVYTAEVEGALTEHPDVDDVAVVGVPDEEWGRRVHAIIQPADFEQCPGTDRLDEHCRERLAAYKAPKSYEFLRALHRNQAGKIRRSALVAERQHGWTKDMQRVRHSGTRT